jgi:transposase
MYLKKTPNKNGRIRLSIVDGYYDKQKKCARQITVESLGFLDELEKQYDDPLAHFTQRVEQLKKEKVEKNRNLVFSFSPSERLDKNQPLRKNVGYAVPSSIYHELGIHTFLLNRQRHTKMKFNSNHIMELLVFMRLLYPASKKKTYERKDLLFEKSDYSLDDVYRCLTFFAKYEKELQLRLHQRVTALYGRDTSLLYYDVTNYYFETDKTNDFQRKGVCKEHRPNPIVQMGLFMDNNGLPITYELFSGNTNDCLTYRPNFGRIKRDYDLGGRVITVADKGMTTGDNIWYTTHTPTKDGYVFSMSVRGADKELKTYVLDDSGYEWLGTEYKRKSRLYPRIIRVTSNTGKKLNKTVHEKQVIFYSEKYDKRAKEARAAVLAKAQDLIDRPGSYTKATSHGAAGYVKNISFDKETGEIIKLQKVLELDMDKIKAEEALDGYYAIITSEYKESDDRIIEIYRGLWRIEESFRVIKSDLEARPVFVSRNDHIHAHFLICFISLLISRLMELRLDRSFSITRILESLRNAECTHLKQNYYLFDYYDEVLEQMEKEFHIPFSNRIQSLGEIKKILASTKKGEKTL